MPAGVFNEDVREIALFGDYHIDGMANGPYPGPSGGLDETVAAHFMTSMSIPEPATWIVAVLVVAAILAVPSRVRRWS